MDDSLGPGPKERTIFSTLVLILAGIGGFVLSRDFVRRRLRYVDAVHSPIFPVAAGVVAALVTWPLAFLPLVTTTTSAIFGLAAGFGTRSGAKAIRAGS